MPRSSKPSNARSAAKPVILPPALKRALADDPAAKAAFDALAPSHRREYAQWVAEARTEETRLKRIAATLDLAFTERRGR